MENHTCTPSACSIASEYTTTLFSLCYWGQLKWWISKLNADLSIHGHPSLASFVGSITIYCTLVTRFTGYPLFPFEIGFFLHCFPFSQYFNGWLFLFYSCADYIDWSVPGSISRNCTRICFKSPKTVRKLTQKLYFFPNFCFVLVNLTWGLRNFLHIWIHKSFHSSVYQHIWYLPPCDSPSQSVYSEVLLLGALKLCSMAQTFAQASSVLNCWMATWAPSQKVGIKEVGELGKEVYIYHNTLFGTGLFIFISILSKAFTFRYTRTHRESK